MAGGMDLTIGGPGREHYVIWDAHGRVVKNFHTNDKDFAQRTFQRLNESFELLGGVRMEVNPKEN
jgi:hypothetical protein